MAHTEKYLLVAVNAKTGAVIRKKWVYDRYTAECFAADWHMAERTRNANIFLDETLIYGHPSASFPKISSDPETGAQKRH